MYKYELYCGSIGHPVSHYVYSRESEYQVYLADYTVIWDNPGLWNIYIHILSLSQVINYSTSLVISESFQLNRDPPILEIQVFKNLKILKISKIQVHDHWS